MRALRPGALSPPRALTPRTRLTLPCRKRGYPVPVRDLSHQQSCSSCSATVADINPGSRAKSLHLRRPAAACFSQEVNDPPPPMSRCIPDDQAAASCPVDREANTTRGSRARRSAPQCLEEIGGPSACQRLPSGPAIAISQSRPLLHPVLSTHCSLPDPDATRIEWASLSGTIVIVTSALSRTTGCGTGSVHRQSIPVLSGWITACSMTSSSA